MKKVKFRIEDNCYISIGETLLDLHNDYDFTYMHYYPETNQLRVYWVKSEGDWVKSNVPKEVELVFDDLFFYKTHFVEAVGTVEDRTTLTFIGYLHPDDIEIMDGCLDEEESDERYHIILGFENGLSVKVFSRQVRCLVKVDRESRHPLISIRQGKKARERKAIKP